MRKTLLSVMMLSTLTVATTSLTSCKDYDDDINNLQTQVDGLSTAKTNLESEIASLKTQLETANGKLTTLESTVGANTADITKAKSDIAGLESRLTTAEKTLQSINETLAKKVDQTEFNDSIKSIYGKLESIEDGLGAAIKSNTTKLTNEETARKAADADLQQQLDAINKLLGADKDGKLTGSDYQALKDAVEKLQGQVGDLNYDELKAQLQNLSNSIDKINANIDVLNVLLEKSLRSLTFIPQSYYWGIEATSLRYLSFDAVKDFPAAAWNVKETKGYDDDSRYATEAGTKVLTFAATYHMNPSSATLDPKKNTVSVEANDVPFTRATAEAGLSVKSWNADKGILTVNLDVKDPTKIKTVADNQMVTNFASVVNMSTTAGKDTTITSDYATLYTEKISGLKLALTNNDVNGHIIANAPKSALSPCALTGGTDYGHLMQTVHEAGTTFDAQVYCVWNQTLDLRKFVETHYKNVKGLNEKLDDATFNANFEYKFELTAFYQGKNTTDESAHAAIATDGYTFRPQAPTADGKQAAYGSDQVRAQEVGRTPIVRVSLVDKETGKVYDYGYIRIKITDSDPVVKADEFINYDGADYAYNGECTAPAWSFATTWNVTEEDLYKKLGLTREEFEKNYTIDGDVDDLNQYQKGTDGKFVALTDKIGTASTVTDKVTSGDGTMSSTLKWELTSEQAYKLFVTDKKSNVSVAVKYVSKDKTVGPDVYVQFTTGKRVGTMPTAVVDLDAAKNSTVWCATNAAKTGTGLDEIHMNVNSPEDNAINANGDKPFVKTLAEAFKGNKINASEIITSLTDKTAGKEYAADKLTLDLVFDQANVGKEFKGVSGKTYVLSLSSDAKTLQANVKGETAKQDIVKITGTDVNAEKAEYQETEYAKDLLNYKAHNALDNNTLTAIVGIVAKNSCHNLPLTGKTTFNVRFLRPLNITSTTGEVEDAATGELQTIDLMKLMTFTDFRDAWKEGYKSFYGITGVKVVGVNNGEKISSNENVLTDQNGNTTMVPLKNVNGAIDFTYNNGVLTYRNYNQTTATFHVQIPVVVTYDWGEVPQTITVTVKETHNNAKKH
jgi:peptidoglycan hydrolase CwlO-like protein